MKIPNIVESTIADNSPLVDAIAFQAGSDVFLDTTVADAGNTPTYWIREGLVCVYDSTLKTWLEADSTHGGDRNAPATVTSIAVGDGTWNSAVVTLKNRGGVATTVTLQAGTATVAAAVTDLNNDAKFAARYKASTVATLLQIQTLGGGADEFFTASCSAATMYGAGVTLGGNGSDADYRVTLEAAIVVDENGTACNATAASARIGHFSSSRLRSLTAEAKAVLARRGSFFD